MFKPKNNRQVRGMRPTGTYGTQRFDVHYEVSYNRKRWAKKIICLIGLLLILSIGASFFETDEEAIPDDFTPTETV